MSTTPPPTRTRSGSATAEHEQLLRSNELRREELRRRRRRDLIVLGVSVSLLAHLALMVWFASRFRAGSGRAGPEPVSYEFAIMPEEELTELEDARLDDLAPEVISDLDQMTESEPVTDLQPAVPAAELAVSRTGAQPTLGGSGDGTAAGGLSGGGAGVSFFGVSSRGRRFAFIVDQSGSMGDNRKMEIAKQELARSIDTLPDYASFHVVLFSTTPTVPPMQSGWMRARPSTINRFVRWLNAVDPSGGTEPLPAFQLVFGLDVRPDVIFFLTDGQIPEDTAQLVADMNKRGERVVINTIAFGDERSQDLLRRMASQSGGTYRFVPAGGN